MRIMELDRDDPSKVPTKVVVELVPGPDGSVRATWHDETFRDLLVRLKPIARGDDGELVAVDTPELLFKYAAQLYGRGQVYLVLP